MEYIVIKDGIVVKHCCSAIIPQPEKDEKIVKCPKGYGGEIGDKATDFIKDYSAYTKKKVTEIEKAQADALEKLREANKKEPEEPSEEIKAQIYLNSTDWYVVRFTETGKPIPDEVTAKRAACRKLLSK